MSVFVHQRQIRDLVNALNDLSGAVDSMSGEGVLLSGGVFHGNLTVDGDVSVTGDLNLYESNFYLDNINRRLGINIPTPEGNLHIFSNSGDVSIIVSGSGTGDGLVFKIGDIDQVASIKSSGNFFVFEQNYDGTGIVPLRFFEIRADDSLACEVRLDAISSYGDLRVNNVVFSDILGEVEAGESALLDRASMTEFAGQLTDVSVKSFDEARFDRLFLSWNGSAVYVTGGNMDVIAGLDELVSVTFRTRLNFPFVELYVDNGSRSRIAVAGISKKFLR